MRQLFRCRLLHAPEAAAIAGWLVVFELRWRHPLRGPRPLHLNANRWTPRFPMHRLLIWDQGGAALRFFGLDGDLR